MNFNLNKGECIGIIGQSGSGKSTLAKLLVQLEHPVTGNLALHQNLAKTQIQMVFQDPYSSLNPALRIGDAITEVIAIHHPKLDRNERILLAKKLLEETGIDPSFMHKKPASFSGGQRQRICIARALAANPEVLVCDEAVAALDISVQAQVINLLKKLQFSRGLSIVFITHDMQIAKHMCNRILVLYDGNLVEEGETTAIFQNPTHPYSKKLIAHYHA
jgi:ABC-type glutathione transport system ATPase component